MPDFSDLVSANGLVEYLNIEQTRDFFQWSRSRIFKTGQFVFSIRNRLYNLFSLNDFTRRKIAAGTVDKLPAEALAISDGVLPETLATAIEPASLESEDIIHPRTSGIAVEVRHMFTPAQMGAMLAEAGFRKVDVFPCHIHASPPALRGADPMRHASLSYALQEHARALPHLITQATALMIRAEPA